MKSALKFILVSLAILLFSSWAAPLLFQVLPFKYERILSRLITILFLGAVYFLYVRGRERESLVHVGLNGPARFPWFLTGFLFGVFTLIAIVAVELMWGAVGLHVDFKERGFLYYLFRALSTGIAVGLFEEWFFRGYVFKAFRRGLSMGWAMFWMNAFYSLVHFIKPGNLQGGDNASFLNSIKLLLGVYTRFEEPLPIFMGFVGLLIFGYLLTWAVLRTGSLYLSMGIHAGMVTALKLNGRVVQSTYSGWDWFFGDKRYYNGILGWLCLTAGLLILVRLIRILPWPRRA